ncbi:glycosyltransferase family 4 protein [Desulfotomaculum copahuensis]|uniref:Glycosyl transferase family 1 n=1 Tax=Desulfotomaculum copahuensis TaxID=1838280 RepID=A0A1B7LE41_9FIRM|nr:glycosyltransferase family 4 protein [Desulfotomaculum copahuensis]OAT81367.1 glycosyl transferase family 1 [Desulfotomaculum copahuensis]
MKIGVFTDSYRPYTSGVVRSIETFTSELTSLGHDIFIFAPSYPNCQKENRVFRFASIPAPTNPDFTLALPFSLQLRQTMRRWEPEIIHVHSPFLLGRLGAHFAKQMGVPLVFTFHTLYDQYVHYVPFAREVTRELTRRFCRDFCNQCDLVIVPTGVIGEHLIKMGVRTAVKKIPTGIKLEEFSAGNKQWLRHKYKIAPEEKILLFVGRLGQEKNIGYILDNFAAIVAELPATRLVIVGGGPEEEAIKKQTDRLGLKNQVILTGTLPRSEVINCYCGADIFIFGSKTETQGLVLAEAKAAGLPVVAVRAFGAMEMVRDGEDGFLTEAGDRKAFIKGVQQLLTDRELYQRMSKQALLNAGTLSSRQSALSLLVSFDELIKTKEKYRKAR